MGQKHKNRQSAATSLPRPLIFGVSALLITVMVTIYFLGFSGGPALLVKAESGPYRESLEATGVLIAGSSHLIRAPGYSSYSYHFKFLELIDDGTMVRKGDVIAKFDDSDVLERIEKFKTKIADYEDRLRNAKKTAEMALDRVHDRHDSAKSALVVAHLEKEASEFSSGLHQKKTVLREIKAEIQVDQSERNVTAQGLANERTIRYIEKSLRYYETALKEAERGLELLVLRAPADGLFLLTSLGSKRNYRKAQVGDSFHYNRDFGIIPDLSDIEIIFEIVETEINRIFIGQKAEILLDSFPQKIFGGEINFISTVAIPDRKNELIRKFTCRIKVKEVDQSHLRPGMTGLCRITVRTMETAVTLPRAAVFYSEEGRPYCVRSDGVAVPVILGSRRDDSVVIVAGISGGEEVYLENPGVQLNPGQPDVFQASTSVQIP